MVVKGAELEDSRQKWRRRKIQFGVFVGLFSILEVILRLAGMIPGNLIDDFKVQENPVYEPRFFADELGINYIDSNATTLMLGTVINKQGFRSKINYTRYVVDSLRHARNKKVLMIIGDSFVEGCCPDTVTNSFPDLIERSGDYIVLNLGISGTDPVQYKLVAQKYIELLKPDIVLTVFYFGNDILTLVRKPEPNVPLTFPFKNNKWIFGIAPNHLSGKENYNFKSAQEAYLFYVNNYTMHGNNRNWFEKIIKHSVCFSKVYLATEHQLLQRKWAKNHPNYHVDANEVAYNNLNEIRKVCVANNAEYIFTSIPAPLEAKENLKEKYKDVFKDIEWYAPTDLTRDDYDGQSISNHLNNKGHLKYTVFLKSVLDKSK